MPNGEKKKLKTQLEVWLDGGCDKTRIWVPHWTVEVRQRCDETRMPSVAALNRRPTSVRKYTEQRAIVPRVSSAIATKRKLCERQEYLASFGCTGKCVRLSRPLDGFWTHFKSLHFHSFISYYYYPVTSQ